MGITCDMKTGCRVSQKYFFEFYPLLYRRCTNSKAVSKQLCWRRAGDAAQEAERCVRPLLRGSRVEQSPSCALQH